MQKQMKYSERAISVMELARASALTEKSEVVKPEHLIHGILRLRRGPALDALWEKGLATEAFKKLTPLKSELSESKDMKLSGDVDSILGIAEIAADTEKEKKVRDYHILAGYAIFYERRPMPEIFNPKTNSNIMNDLQVICMKAKRAGEIGCGSDAFLEMVEASLRDIKGDKPGSFRIADQLPTYLRANLDAVPYTADLFILELASKLEIQHPSIMSRIAEALVEVAKYASLENRNDVVERLESALGDHEAEDSPACDALSVAIDNINVER